ncbi:MAG: TIGR04133 family radical SAM/SPASM protein [Spirochaetaceae bacterium]|jgi:radical SAM enzyme (rSAM/lipoprotein system)|nr:TIGR04133 family radical SAM/SPASM protein [Spirochaetaceae bacterium]
MTPNKILRWLHRLFKQNETKLHELNYLFWECTQRCNLRCLHCGSDCASDASVSDMPFNDFLQAILPITRIYKSSDITVVITGGEPLLRHDLVLCGRTLREYGFHWGIVTNGYGYTFDIHSKLLAAGMGTITLSLDGLENNHNWLRANKKSFENAVKALDLIVSSKGLAYDVVTCVNRKNIGELSELRDFLISKKVKAWRLFTIAPIGRAANNNDMLLTSDESKQLMDFIARSRSRVRMKNNIDVKLSCEAYVGQYEERVRDSYFFCRAGINIASVLIDGSISACPNINRNFAQGNIYHDYFPEVWNSRFEIMRNRNWTKTGICADCKDYKNCNGGAMHLWNEKKETIITCINQTLK